MNQAKLKLQRTEAILKELVPEAISTLSDERVQGVSVVDVVCSKGRSDAKVYLDPSFFEEQEKEAVISILSKARVVIEKYISTEQGWYRTPKLSFTFDDSLEKENKMRKLFKQIGVDF